MHFNLPVNKKNMVSQKITHILCVGKVWRGKILVNEPHVYCRFTGLNVSGFNPTLVLWKYFCIALARSAYYLQEVLIFTEKLSQYSKS